MADEHEFDRVAQQQREYDALLSEYYSAIAAVDNEDTPALRAPRKSRAQRLLELQDRLATMCVSHGEYRHALDHYTSILEWVEQHTSLPASVGVGGAADAEEKRDPPLPGPPVVALAPEVVHSLPDLKTTTITNMAVMHARLGDKKTAVSLLLEAKQLLREGDTEPPKNQDERTRRQRLEAIVGANYSALLLSQGSIDDAVAAAEKCLELCGQLSSQAAKAIALSVLSSSQRSRGGFGQAQEHAQQAVRTCTQAESIDRELQARALNNLGLGACHATEYATAEIHFTAAYRATLSIESENPPLQASILLNLGHALAQLNKMTAIPESNGKGARQTNVGPRECFEMAARFLEAAGSVDDHLSALMQASLGDFYVQQHDQLQAKTHLEECLPRLSNNQSQEHRNDTAWASEHHKLQSFTDSTLGAALLINGEFEPAEEAYQRDLELALETEDIYSQLRALRNLAVLYGTTQRYHEAITLWRETVEIAVVLNNKQDLLVGYLGLGTTLKELTVHDSSRGEFQEVVQAEENQLRPLFHKARALALELGDVERQVIAQRGLVGTYEWQPRGEELEQRLEESDAFVRLCEQLGDPRYCADAYRSLANAINVQVARLAERGQRFADAIKVLKFKRNSMLQQYREVTTSPHRLQRERQQPPQHRFESIQRS